MRLKTYRITFKKLLESQKQVGLITADFQCDDYQVGPAGDLNLLMVAGDGSYLRVFCLPNGAWMSLELVPELPESSLVTP